MIDVVSMQQRDLIIIPAGVAHGLMRDYGQVPDPEHIEMTGFAALVFRLAETFIAIKVRYGFDIRHCSSFVCWPWPAIGRWIVRPAVLTRDRLVFSCSISCPILLRTARSSSRGIRATA